MIEEEATNSERETSTENAAAGAPTTEDPPQREPTNEPDADDPPDGDVLDDHELDDIVDSADETIRGLRIPGAATGFLHDDTVRNAEGKVAFAPPGTMNAAMAGVQMDASGHVDSLGTTNSEKSGTRI